MLDRPWVEWPWVAVTLNPIRGEHEDYRTFCDLTLGRREPNGRIDVLDMRVRCRSFTAEETVRFKTIGWAYKRSARSIESVMDEVSFFARGALPIAVNPKLCRSLIHKAIRTAEAGSTWKAERDHVFVLREKSRWLDLGEWRRCAAMNFVLRGHAVAPFSGLAAGGPERVREALGRVEALAEIVGVKPSWTVKEVLDWDPIPF